MPPPVPIPPSTPPPPHHAQPPSPRPSRFAPYTQALTTLSQRTRTPLPSLVLSFAVLHELTALLPIAGFFFGARALGIGDSVVNALASPSQAGGGNEVGEEGVGAWVREKGRTWVDEGEKWAERVGRRYGVFGFEKRTQGRAADVESSNHSTGEARRDMVSTRLAGDAANAIVAYALTKALLPVRVGVSLYFSPAFSRRVVEPVRQLVIRPFRRRV
ncbi:hypothetical protein EIP91_001091 [Steccherinum ochraceum]|uniref:Uncharacterized protein n=1 Tax=Steccherinum ochraceum TaxID=92696 RepID=A0A4R0RIN9_9APHY|nr:hypothetical protein EIP91_001091 [Steccherinum ochraceum]